jgi:NitT/TauT family transport system ATP-binding protein
MENDLNSTKKPIIVFEDVEKRFNNDTEIALRDVSFSIMPGEFVCLVGLSGGGKSTILKIIAGLEKQSRGTVEIPPDISMVFQNGALFPWLSVFDNVALGLRAKHTEEHIVQKQVRTYIELMGLADFAGKYPRELSGGQRQRVGIARALAVDPSVLLLDEPFSALDVKTTEELHKDLLAIWQKTKKTIVMVSHSIEESVTLAERIVFVKDHTIRKIFSVSVARPRREQEQTFMHQVQEIRKEFFD